MNGVYFAFFCLFIKFKCHKHERVRGAQAKAGHLARVDRERHKCREVGGGEQSERVQGEADKRHCKS